MILTRKNLTTFLWMQKISSRIYSWTKWNQEWRLKSVSIIHGCAQRQESVWQYWKRTIWGNFWQEGDGKRVPKLFWLWNEFLLLPLLLLNLNLKKVTQMNKLCKQLPMQLHVLGCVIMYFMMLECVCFYHSQTFFINLDVS